MQTMYNLHALMLVVSKGNIWKYSKKRLVCNFIKIQILVTCFPVSFHKCLRAPSFFHKGQFSNCKIHDKLRSKDIIKHVQNRKYLIYISLLGGKKNNKKTKKKTNPETVIQRCSAKNKFLKISQNSLKNNCAGVSFYWFKVFSCAFFGHLQKFQEHLLCKTSVNGCF